MKKINIKKFSKRITIIIGIVLALILLVSKASLSYKELEYKTICVSEGDTLWYIAKYNQENNQYYNGKDIRYIVNDLMKVNNLNNTNIKVNQKLLIPVI